MSNSREGKWFICRVIGVKHQREEIVYVTNDVMTMEQYVETLRFTVIYYRVFRLKK